MDGNITELTPKLDDSFPNGMGSFDDERRFAKIKLLLDG